MISARFDSYSSSVSRPCAWRRGNSAPDRAICARRRGVHAVIEFGRADTEYERAEVARFFYSVYVEEMGRFRDVADHERRELRDPEDAYSWLFVARDAGRIVGTCRLTWGGDGLSERQIRYYCLEPFLAELPPERLIVGERAMVAPEYRGARLYHDLGQTTTPVVAAHDVLLAFGASEPHLIPMYLR